MKLSNEKMLKKEKKIMLKSRKTNYLLLYLILLLLPFVAVAAARIITSTITSVATTVSTTQIKTIKDMDGL